MRSWAATLAATAIIMVGNRLVALASPVGINLTFAVPAHPTLLSAGAASLPASTHATLHTRGAPLSAPLRRDGTFVFVDVAPGSYLLGVHTRDYAFESLRVDVDVAADESGSGLAVPSAHAWQTFRGNEWVNVGEKRGDSTPGAPLPTMVAEVRVIAKKDFYQQRQGFSPLAFLKNPMILMGMFSLCLIVGMPYLMENMDDETKAEFEQMQKSSPLGRNPAQQLQNFDLASFLAGKANEKPQQAPPPLRGGNSPRRHR